MGCVALAFGLPLTNLQYIFLPNCFFEKQDGKLNVNYYVILIYCIDACKWISLTNVLFTL